MTRIDMTHENLPGRVISVGEQQIPHRERAGWRRADAADAHTDLAGDPADDLDGDHADDSDDEAGKQPAESTADKENAS